MDGVWVSVGRSRETGTGAGVQAIEHSQQSEGKSVGSGGSGTHRPRRRFRAPPRPCPRPPRSWRPRQTWPQPRAWSLLRKTSCPRAGSCVMGGGARSSFFSDEKTRDAGEKRRLFPCFLQTVCSLTHFRRCCALIGRAKRSSFFPRHAIARTEPRRHPRHPRHPRHNLRAHLPVHRIVPARSSIPPLRTPSVSEPESSPRRQRASNSPR